MQRLYPSVSLLPRSHNLPPSPGVTMKLMDEVAGIVAARHCKTNIVTASVDAINFHEKIKKGTGGGSVHLVLLRCHIPPPLGAGAGHAGRGV